MSTRRFISGIIFLTLFVIGSYFHARYKLNQDEKELQRIYAIYPPVLVETELLALVNDIYKPVGYKETPSIAFITFKDIGNYRVVATSKINSGRVGIDEVCIGDSLIKKAGSDTIWLKHRHEGYQVSHLFLLGNLRSMK